MIRIATMTLGLLLVTSPVFAAQDAKPNDPARDYEVRFTPGPKSEPLEIPIVTIVYTGSDRVEEVPLESSIDSIDEVHYAGSRCIILGTLGLHAGSSVTIVDVKTAEVVASVWCFRPVVSPNENCVAFEKWYPRFTPREDIWPTVLAIAISNPENGPFEVYPKSAVPQDPTVNHCVVSPKVWDAAGGTLAFLDVYGADGDWKSPYKLFCVVVRFKDGKVKQMKKAQVRVEDFVRAESKPDRVAFAAESLEISGETLRGRLFPQSYWIRPDFSFALETIEREVVLGASEIQETGPDRHKPQAP